MSASITPLIPNWSLTVELPDWLAIPARPFDEAAWRDAITVILSTIAEIDAGLAGAEGAPTPGTPLDLPAALDNLVDFAASLPDDRRLVAGLGVAGRWPLPVIVRVWASTGNDDDLLDAAGARGGLPIEQPTVEYLPEELGDGIRVTRFDLDDDGAVWASVSCARRADGVDTVLLWRTTELDLIPLFSGQLEALLENVLVNTDPGTEATE